MILALTALEHIDVPPPVQHIGAIITTQEIPPRVAAAGQRRRAAQHQLLLKTAEHKAHRALHLVPPVVTQTRFNFTRVIDQIKIVAWPAAQVIDAFAAVEHVLARETDEDVSGVIAVQKIIAGVAGAG